MLPRDRLGLDNCISHVARSLGPFYPLQSTPPSPSPEMNTTGCDHFSTWPHQKIGDFLSHASNCGPIDIDCDWIILRPTLWWLWNGGSGMMEAKTGRMWENNGGLNGADTRQEHSAWEWCSQWCLRRVNAVWCVSPSVSPSVSEIVFIVPPPTSPITLITLLVWLT